MATSPCCAGSLPLLEAGAAGVTGRAHAGLGGAPGAVCGTCGCSRITGALLCCGGMLGGVRPPRSARPVDQAPLPERAPGRGVGSETAALPRERLFLQTRLSVSLTATQPSWRGGRSRQSIRAAASRRGRCRCGGWPGDLWLARLLAPQLPRADRVGGSRKGSHRPGVSARAGHQASRQAPNLVTPPV